MVDDRPDSAEEAEGSEGSTEAFVVKLVGEKTRGPAVTRKRAFTSRSRSVHSVDRTAPDEASRPPHDKAQRSSGRAPHRTGVAEAESTATRCSPATIALSSCRRSYRSTTPGTNAEANASQKISSSGVG